MTTSKKFFVILCAAVLAIFTSCNNNLFKKSGEIVFDFSGLCNKNKTSSRNAIDELIQGEKDCFVSLALEGTFTYNETFNLREKTSCSIDDIPVGSKVKAIVELYTMVTVEEVSTKMVLFSGESQEYVIPAGTTQITVQLNKNQTEIEIIPEDDPNGENGENGGSTQEVQEDPKVTIWVRYDQNYQGAYWNADENKSYEDPTNDGTTKETGFYYIQSAVDWIAENGDGDTDYEIMLVNTNTFDQDVYSDPSNRYLATVIFGQRQATADNLNGHAKSITLTSQNTQISAIKANHGIDNVLIRTPVPVIFKNIKIETETNNRILDIEYGISANVFLTSGTVFTNSSTNQSSGSAAIWMEGGSVTMQDNALIEKFYSNSAGGAVYLKYGYFTMEGNSRIENCKSGSNGGAIYMYNAPSPTVTLNDNATIYKCTSESDGGAIYQYGGTIRINSGSIIECKADSNYSKGGAICMDGTNRNITMYLKGGTIKDNEAISGSAIYIKEGNNNTASLIMSDNACVDLSNDIYTSGPKIKLGNTLTTTNAKAALLSLYDGTTWNSVLTSDDSEAVENSYSKFFVRLIGNSDDAKKEYYLNPNGTYEEFADGNYITNSAEVQIGDIVFANNKRVRAEKFSLLSKNLRDSIAGVVFYAGSDSGLIGTSNLIVGTATYNAAMKTSKHGALGFTMFDKSSSVSDFPKGSRTGSYGEIRDTSSSVAIDQATINCSKTSGNTKLNEGFDWTEQQIDNYHNKLTYKAVQEIMQSITNNQTSSYPLYQKIFEYGKNFDENSNYKLNTADSEITDNWYIPTIAELKLFYDAMNNSTFSDIYTKLCGSLKNDNYYSGSAIIGQTASYPDQYRVNSNNNAYYYAYYYTIDFASGLIKCDPTNQSLYSIPVHVYVPSQNQSGD